MINNRKFDDGGLHMNTSNILLTRIDNRLVHGQIGCVWEATLGADVIVVVDDIASYDAIQQTLMDITAKTTHVKIVYLPLENAYEKIREILDTKKIFLVIRTPREAKQLYDSGIHFKELNIGNMHFSTGKKAIRKKVYVNEEDKENLNYLREAGVHVYIQDIPGDKIETL